MDIVQELYKYLRIQLCKSKSNTADKSILQVGYDVGLQPASVRYQRQFRLDE